MSKLNTDKITNSIARAAIEAWQIGDAKAWRAHFTPDVKLLDDGAFHTKSWGDFKTYFKFHINPEGKIFQLEIGQADY